VIIPDRSVSDVAMLRAIPAFPPFALSEQPTEKHNRIIAAIAKNNFVFVRIYRCSAKNGAVLMNAAPEFKKQAY
jgi:hypothetical protein